jgi:hypothetical protein
MNLPSNNQSALRRLCHTLISTCTATSALCLSIASFGLLSLSASAAWADEVKSAPADNMVDDAINSTKFDTAKLKEEPSKASSFVLRASEDAKFKLTNSTTLEFNYGEMVVEALRPCDVVTPMGHLHLKNHAVVLVQVVTGFNRFFSICDNGDSDTELYIDHFRHNIAPGTAAFVSDHPPRYGEIVGRDDIARRRVRLHNLPGGIIVTTLEFSLLQAVQRNELLTHAINSPDTDMKDLKERVVKTCAVLNMVTSRHGTYSNGSHY